MESELQFEQFLDQHVAWLRDTMKRYGWALQAVGPGDERDEPPFTYTVGLSGFDDHPELVVLGLPSAAASRVLNDLGELVRHGRRLRAGDVVIDAVVRLPLTMVEVVDSSADLLYANEFFRREDGPPVPALQVVWSDRQARFPWDSDCSVPAYVQPLLGVRPPA